MRPRKPVVVWCENEVTASDLAFILNNQIHVKAEVVDMAAFFRRCLDLRNSLSAVLIDTGNHAVIGVLNKFALQYGVPVTVVCRIAEAETPTILGAVTLPAGTPNAQVIDHVRLLTTRRRGPHVDTIQVAEVA